VICADAATVQVLLGDQPAAGLFVLYRVAPTPPDADHPQAKIQSVAPPAPPAPFTLCFVDGQGFLQKVIGDDNPWHEIAAQLPELEAAAIATEKKGEKKKSKKNVKALPRSCESEKLHADQDYEVALVAHPSLKIAKAAQTYLETGQVNGPYPFPKDKATMLIRGKLKLVEAEGTQQLTLPIDGLASDKGLADLFWPKGSARYGGWVLYRFMPYDHLDEVKKQVAKLSEDLGALRFPASTSQNGPFPSPGSGEPGFGLNTAAIVHRFQQDVAEGKAFQLASQAASPAATQTKGSAPTGWRTLSPRASWNWLCGTVADLKGKPYAFTMEQVHPGVVDARVGDAIAGWLKDKLRHPGAVLVEIRSQMDRGEYLWARPELVFSIEMLRVLLTRFGVPYGAAMTHTYRPIQAAGGTGRAECSNHKLGLAADFAISSAAGGKAKIDDHGHPPDYFPVRYQAVWGDPQLPPAEKLSEQLNEATNARIQAQKNLDQASADLADAAVARKNLAEASKQQKAAEAALKKADKKEDDAAAALRRKKAIGDSKADQKLTWVICAHSHWDVFAEGKQANELAAELAQCLGKPEKPGDPWDVENEYRRLLMSGFPSPPTGDAAKLVDKFVANLGKLCEELTAMEPLEFRHQFFRKTVRQFLYNPFECDGGDEGPEIAADSDDAWRTGYFDAAHRIPAFHVQEAEHKRVHSFVNFSRLANECDLWGISAQPGNKTTKGSFRNPMSDPDIPVKPPARVSYDVNKMTFSPIAALLEDLKAAGSEAPDDQVDLAYPDGRKYSLKASELDIDLIIAWAEEMGKQQKDRIGEVKPDPATGKTDIPPPAISWDGNDAVIFGHPKTAREIEAFFKAYDTKTFYIIAAGSNAKSVFSDGAVMQGNEIFAAFKKYLEKLGQPAQGEVGKPSTKKSKSDYCITVRPIFQKKEKLSLTCGVTITLPARGVPAPLEWWHYEQGLRGKDTYGKDAEDLGYSQDFLKAQKEPPDKNCAPETGGFGYPENKMGLTRRLNKIETGGSAADDSDEGGSDG
jgi:hypothetical protein